MISHLWSLTDLLKRPPSLDSAADDAHPEVVLLGGEAREGERGLPQGARHQQTLGGGHRHHQVCPIFFACNLSSVCQFENVGNSFQFVLVLARNRNVCASK